MLKILKNSKTVTTRQPSGSNKFKVPVYRPIIFLKNNWDFWVIYSQTKQTHVDINQIYPSCAANSVASREIGKQTSFLSLGDILWAFPFTPVNNAWLGCRFRQVPLLKVRAQLLIRHRGPRECIMGLTTELPQTVRQKHVELWARRLWFQRGN